MPWSEQGLLAACAVGALAISATGTAWAIVYARRRGMLDQPGERRSHATATPRGGGIGIVIALLLALGLLGWWRDAPSWWSMAAGLLLVASVGWWDDHRPLPIVVRLGAHVAAGLALALGLHLQGAGLPAVLAALVLVPGLVNAWNFMDGIDGLAASQALLCATGLACLLAGPWQLLGFVMTAACLGFLPFNLPPARIFLGDVGSGAHRRPRKEDTGVVALRIVLGHIALERLCKIPVLRIHSFPPEARTPPAHREENERHTSPVVHESGQLTRLALLAKITLYSKTCACRVRFAARSHRACGVSVFDSGPAAPRPLTLCCCLLVAATASVRKTALTRRGSGTTTLVFPRPPFREDLTRFAPVINCWQCGPYSMRNRRVNEQPAFFLHVSIMERDSST